MQFLKDNVIHNAIHIGSQLGFQLLFYVIVRANYSLDYIIYGVNSLAFLIGWFVSTTCVYLTVDRLINRSFYKEPLTTATFTPPLAFVLLLLVSYVFDGLTGDVSNGMAWVNLFSSLVLATLCIFYEDIAERQEERNLHKEKEEPLPTKAPFKLTHFNNDVSFLWNRITDLLEKLEATKIEERHELKNIQYTLCQMEPNYTNIPHEKRKEADQTIQSILDEFDKRVSVIEEELHRKHMTELEKVQLRYKA